MPHYKLNYFTRLICRDKNFSTIQMLQHAKHAQEGPNLYNGDFSYSVVELASCIDCVHCLQAMLQQTQWPPGNKETLASVSKCQ